MKILELPKGFVTPASSRPIWRDDFGVRHGQTYKPLHTSQKPGLGLRAQVQSPKLERSVHLLSRGEIAAFFYLLYCPYVVDMREQYPVYDSEAFMRALRQGKRLHKSKCLTIDFHLTLALPPDFRHHSHWVSIKFDKTVLSQQDIQRAEREFNLADDRQSTWEMMDSRDFPAGHLRNFAALWTHFKFTRAWDLYSEASYFARRIPQRSLRGTTHDVMTRHARSLGIGVDHAFRLLSTAVSFGHLWLDHSFHYSADRALHLDSLHYE
ncbi:hypothetical protein [Pandoraea sp. NPDC090278]|uniref:hypothetical protein n=1 Tax=Pandoraea sp. NPDC090278 TaxID=3364391 RepID=UPI00383B8387